MANDWKVGGSRVLNGFGDAIQTFAPSYTSGSSTGAVTSITYNPMDYEAEVTMRMTPEEAQQFINPEPAVDDSPLAWLRREVNEICELARVA